MENGLKILSQLINDYENILIGAGSGLSTAAGHDYGGERFNENFSDFGEKYGFEDMYSGGFYPFRTPEEKWAFWSRMVDLNRYQDKHLKLYDNLYELVKNKNYFVITTNVDHLFQKSGFNKDRLFYTQGDYGLFQCSVPCSNKTYDNEAVIKEMVKEQENMKVPTDLIPKCPNCHQPMAMNLRADETFVQDEGWYKAYDRYENYLNHYAHKPIIFMDLGIGYNTPGIIKYPFWRMTLENPNSIYVCINKESTEVPKQILDRSILIQGNIKDVIEELLKLKTDKIILLNFSEH